MLEIKDAFRKSIKVPFTRKSMETRNIGRKNPVRILEILSSFFRESKFRIK